MSGAAATTDCPRGRVILREGHARDGYGYPYGRLLPDGKGVCQPWYRERYGDALVQGTAADDNEAAVATLAAKLRSYGFEVQVIGDGCSPVEQVS